MSKEAALGLVNGAGVGLIAAIGMYMVASSQNAERPIMLAQSNSNGGILQFTLNQNTCPAIALAEWLVERCFWRRA
jgi:hypothetical protein